MQRNQTLRQEISSNLVVQHMLDVVRTLRPPTSRQLEATTKRGAKEQVAIEIGKGNEFRNEDIKCRELPKCWAKYTLRKENVSAALEACQSRTKFPWKDAKIFSNSSTLACCHYKISFCASNESSRSRPSTSTTTREQCTASTTTTPLPGKSHLPAHLS